MSGFAVEIAGCVWTAEFKAIPGMKKLRIKKTPDARGRGLKRDDFDCLKITIC